jgi:hypothetical protein
MVEKWVLGGAWLCVYADLWVICVTSDRTPLKEVERNI